MASKNSAGTTGFAERSRVQPATAQRAPGGGGYGASASAVDSGAELDPFTQAERYVARVAGAAELQWAQRRTAEYARLRDLRLKVATFRHELLRGAVRSADSEATLAHARAAAAVAVPAELLARGSGAVCEYLVSVAAPEQLALVLPHDVVRQIEDRVSQLKMALHQDYTASTTQ